MPKNDTNDLNEQSDVNDQKWPKMTKSNQKWPKTTKTWLKITPDDPKWQKTTQKRKVLPTNRPTNGPAKWRKCSKMTKNDLKQPKMTINNKKMTQNNSRWPK